MFRISEGFKVVRTTTPLISRGYPNQYIQTGIQTPTMMFSTEFLATKTEENVISTHDQNNSEIFSVMKSNSLFSENDDTMRNTRKDTIA